MNEPTGPAPITPSATAAEQEKLLERLLGTRLRDYEAVEIAHRDLLRAAPNLHRRLLGWMVRSEPDSRHVAIGLALLATSADQDQRHFAGKLVSRLPVGTVAEMVDYIHGWYVDRKLTKYERTRFQDTMTRAYAATAGIVREALQEETDERRDEFLGGEILVTLGSYDKVQQVLDYLELSYRTFPCRVVSRLPLRADQVLIVNCPGEFEPEGIEKIRRFVANGGTLITTDWALQTTVERAFPGVIQYNHRATSDDVVQVSWIHGDSPYTRGVEVPGQTISWWLESSSYPIRIVDDRVTVLVRSTQMGKRYGEDPLVVTFDYGEGTVFHLTSHYYLQRSQGEKAANAVSSGDNTVGQKILKQAEVGDVSGAQLSAAYSSMRLLANILYESRRKCGV